MNMAAMQASAANSPKESPDNVALRATPRQVMRLNRHTLAILTGLLSAAVLGATVWSLQGVKRQRDGASPEMHNVAFGQRRVLLVWTRLIMPDTSSIALDRLPGVDPAGYAGLEDGLDWHWDRILAGGLLSTLLGVGAELAAPQRSGAEGQVIIAAKQSVQDTVNEVGKEITKRNLDIQPTLTIRPGFLLRIVVSKDMVLRPYQPLFYERSGR